MTSDADIVPEGLDLLAAYEAANGQEFADPYAVYRELTAHSPIYLGDVVIDLMEQAGSFLSAWDGPRFSILGYEECNEVIKDAERFSNRVFARSIEVTMGPNLITLDDPEHRIHRILVQYAFTKKKMDQWRDELVEPLVNNHYIDTFIDDGKAELMRQFSLTYPVSVIHHILGLPTDRLLELQTLAVGLILINTRPDIALPCSQRLAELLTTIVQERRDNPGTDVISALCTARLETGESLTDDEILSFLRVLMPAGGETTTRLMGNLMARLLMDPELLARVRNNRALIASAIEESLRIDAPLQLTARLCTRDTELAGVPIPAGATLNVCIGAAGRDPRRYRDPDCFDLDRGATTHLSFGLGPHTCIGMHMARMEVDVALNAFLDRMPNLRLDPDFPPPESHGCNFFSPSAVHVRWD